MAGWGVAGARNAQPSGAAVTTASGPLPGPKSLTRQSYIGSLAGTDCALDFVHGLFLPRSMTLLLRKSSAQARIEGWDPSNRSDNDYLWSTTRSLVVSIARWSSGNPSGGGSCSRSPSRSGEADSAAQPRDGRYIG